MKRAAHSRVELCKAEAAIQAMLAAHDMDAFEEHWLEFLHRLERVWNKSQACFKQNAGWDEWKGRFVSARRSDPLLSYLKNARDTDQHTIAPITVKKESLLTLTTASPSGVARIQRIAIDADGQLLIDNDGDLQLSFQPERAQPLPVVNRGRVYPLPKSHLGRPMASTDAVHLAQAGLAFYADFLDQAEAVFDVR